MVFVINKCILNINEIMSNVKRQVVNELHKSARRNFRRRRTIIKEFGDLWQVDLAEMQGFAKENKGLRYILIVIDCYSKYVWAKPLKNKTATEVHNAMKSILREAAYSAKHLQSDFGKEFYNRHFSSLMEQYNINHYSTFSIKKAAIVERVIRTLKNWLYKEFSARGNYKWYDILPDIINLYNNRVHRTTGMKPVDVKNTTKLSVYNRPKVALKPKFRVGDTVRISKYKGVFEKGYTANYSTELFKVVKVNITNPITYMIEDMDGQPIKGCFYEYELQRTKYPDVYLVEKILKKKGNKLFVKWLGLPSEQNGWINKADMV
jgi:Integrase core domain.